jgi:hypothetical protein
MPWIVNNKTVGTTHRATGWGPTRDLIVGQAEPGDCLVTSKAGPTVRNPSRGVMVYREDYAVLQDLSLQKTSVEARGFYDIRRPVEDAIAGPMCSRLWVIAPADKTVDGPLNEEGEALRAEERAAIEERGYDLEKTWELQATEVRLYTS